MYHTYFLLYLARIYCQHAANCSWCTSMQEQYMRYCLVIQQLPHRYITVTNPARCYNIMYDDSILYTVCTLSAREKTVFMDQYM